MEKVANPNFLGGRPGPLSLLLPLLLAAFLVTTSAPLAISFLCIMTRQVVPLISYVLPPPPPPLALPRPLRSYLPQPSPGWILGCSSMYSSMPPPRIKSRASEPPPTRQLRPWRWPVPPSPSCASLLPSYP